MCFVLTSSDRTKVFRVLYFLFQLKTAQHPTVQFLGNEGVSLFFIFYLLYEIELKEGRKPLTQKLFKKTGRVRDATG